MCNLQVGPLLALTAPFPVASFLPTLAWAGLSQLTPNPKGRESKLRISGYFGLALLSHTTLKAQKQLNSDASHKS